MTEIIRHSRDKTYGRLVAEAASAGMSLEQQIVSEVSIAARPKASVEKARAVPAAALELENLRRLAAIIKR